jgi:hypothetical protein
MIVSNIKKLYTLLAAMLLSFNVYAGDIQVEHAWARATAPGQDSAMVDMVITSKMAASLVGFSSPVCKTVQLHSMTHDHGMMKMREVKSIDLPAGHHVSLKDSGYHLMLIGLHAPLKAGEMVPLTLKVKVGEKDEVIETSATIKPLTDAAPMDAHMHM